jgi:hypothetical protein
MVFEPIIYSLKHCFGSFARNNTPKADPLFGEEKHSRVTINVACWWISGIGVTQRNSKILGNKGRSSFHCEPSTLEHDLSPHRKFKSSVSSPPDNRIELHPSHGRGDPVTGETFGN